MNENAYIPEHLRTGVLADDYQRVANEIRDRGTKIEWVNGRPTLHGQDCSFMFMYPSIIKAEHISPRGN